MLNSSPGELRQEKLLGTRLETVFLFNSGSDKSTQTSAGLGRSAGVGYAQPEHTTQAQEFLFPELLTGLSTCRDQNLQERKQCAVGTYAT
jgi:hypothetical protein